MKTKIIHFDNTTGDFFIQLKGNNAGQVLRQKSPNSIGIICDRLFLVPEYAYYMFTYFFQSKMYQQHIKGSAIPYITHHDITTVFLNYLSGH